MESRECSTGCDFIRLSRLGSQVCWQAYDLQADRAIPAGEGISMVSHCRESRLTFWLPKAEWIAWLQMFPAVPDPLEPDSEMLSLLTAWTLGPVDNWLREQGITPFTSVRGTFSGAPGTAKMCWRLTLATQGYSLPVYLIDVSDEWLTALLQALPPAAQTSHDLLLSCGWCCVSERDCAQLTAGDALPLIGLTGDPERFWLHPEAGPYRVYLMPDGGVEVTEPVPFGEVPEGHFPLTVEAGTMRLNAPELANWCPGHHFTPEYTTALPQLRLTSDGTLWGTGELLKTADGWAVRVLNWRTEASGPLQQREVPRKNACEA